MLRGHSPFLQMAAVDDALSQLGAADFTIGDFVTGYRFIRQLRAVNNAVRQVAADNAAA
ncbi:hypothetical protein D3C72_2331770 [compost metagenome]